MKGIDISNWQKGLIPSYIRIDNKNKVKIDFCICKATEGTYFIDAECDIFIQDCINNNILWAFYHFAGHDNPENEAEFFYNNCKDYFNKGIPILDYEVENEDNKTWCEKFINKLYELSGVWAMIYISASRCKEYYNSWIPNKCGLWVAGYPKNTNEWCEDMPYDITPWNFCAIWQFTSSLILSGYWEKLDGDIAYMNKEAWMKYAKSNSNSKKEDKNKKSKKSIDDLVLETLLGEYGNNEDRKRMLGDKYDEVQNKINKYYKIANEVIDGKWGNGWNREQALTGAGYPYKIIQKIVNDILA